MNRHLVDAPAAPRPIGPYAQAVDTGTVVYCAGQVGLDPQTNRLVEGGIAAEVARVLANLTAVLAALDLGLQDVVKTTVYLVDLADGPLVNDLYGRLMPPPYPARATVQVAALPAGARVEIDAVAVRGVSSRPASG